MPRPSCRVLVVVPLVVGGLLVAVGATTGPAAVAAPVATTPGAFVGLTPARVLDTRSGVGAPKAPVFGTPLHLTVAGRGGVPADAAAVVLTLTVVGTNAGGYLSAYPTGAAARTASVVNWATGQTVAGSATVTLGARGAVDLLARAGRPVDLVADVSGYVVAGAPTAAGAYVARTPTRVLDTRSGVGLPRRPLARDDEAYVQVLGAGGVIPSSAVSAVVGTLTAVGSRTAGYLTVWADGDRPTTSALNFVAGQTVANQVTVPLGTAGGVSLYAGGGPVDVLFDVTGYVVEGAATAPGTYVPVAPSRVLDTRNGGPAPVPGFDSTAAVAGRGGIPRTGAGAVVANLTVTNTTSSGYLTAWPAGRDRPLASNLNWASRRTVANQAGLALGRGGAVGLHLAGATRADVVVDVFGYYVAAPPPAPTGFTATVDAPGTPRQTVVLTWDPPADPVAGYTLRRAVGASAPTTPGEGDVGFEVRGSLPTFTDTTAQLGTTYSYGLFAHDDLPTYSAPAAVVTIAVPGLDPTDLDLGPATVLPLPAGAPEGFSFVHEIACPAAGSCTGVGRFDPLDDVDGGYRAFVLTGHAGVWSAALVPLPADASSTGDAELRGLDCVAVDTCTAVGTYTTRAGILQPLAVTVRGTALSVRTVRLPTPASPSETVLTDVTCTAATSCVAVGSYRLADRTVAVLTLAVDAAAARLTPSTVPAGLGNLRPQDVSCLAAADCVAVGRWGSAADTTSHGLSGRWNGTSWTWAEVPRPVAATSGSLRLLGVDCSTGSCVAAGSALAADGAGIAIRATGDGSTWAVVALPAVRSTTFGGLVECRAGLGCVTVYRSTLGTTVVGPDVGAVDGRRVDAPDGVDAPKISNYAMSCDAALRCALPGSWGATDNSSGRALLTTVVDGVPTTVQVGPVVPLSTSSVLATRVGCAPDGSCVLTGWYSLVRPSTGYLQTFSLAGA